MARALKWRQSDGRSVAAVSFAWPAQDVTPRSAVYRFYNATTGAAISSRPALPSATGSSPIFRFYNTQTGRHFYTVSAAERDSAGARQSELGTGGNRLLRLDDAVAHEAAAAAQ